MTSTELYKDPSIIDWANPIVADFETYYDKDYSLKKVTTEKYIRCDKFECIGLAIKNGSEPTNFYARESGIEVLKQLCLDYPKRPVVFQNATFDAGILAFRYDIHPNFTIDTVVMAKLSGFDRVASSLAETRATNFLDVASRGVFPVALRYASAHTGRYGGGDGSTAKGGTNVQNLPKRSDTSDV